MTTIVLTVEEMNTLADVAEIISGSPHTSRRLYFEDVIAKIAAADPAWALSRESKWLKTCEAGGYDFRAEDIEGHLEFKSIPGLNRGQYDNAPPT